MLAKQGEIVYKIDNFATLLLCNRPSQKILMDNSRINNDAPTSQDAAQVSFGFKDIPASEKTGKVRSLFSQVAGKYDLMNDVLSGGLHRLWKEQFVAMMSPVAHKTYLDMASGTGDIALKIAQRRGTGKGIYSADLTLDMLKAGCEREQHYNQDIQRLCINAEQLPFASGQFDCYSIAYGIRNVTHIDKALREAYRTLKQGGRFMCLEFSMPAVPMIQKIYDIYSFKLLPKLGKWIASDEDSYLYLAESIRRFPSQEQFAQMIREAGFKQVGFESLTAGITTIHYGYKIE